MKENRVQPAGQWSQHQVRVRGDRIMRSVNGAIVSEVSGIGLRQGDIGLEAEGYMIAFR